MVGTEDFGGRPGRRTVLITGGTGGIGQALVATFVALGDDVVFTYAAEAEDPAAVVRRHPQNPPTAVRLDLRAAASIESLGASLTRVPDVVVHNAALGTATAARLTSSNHERDRVLFDVNAVGILALNEVLVPRMVGRGSGTIVLFSSVGGGIAHYRGFTYADAMSKAAVALLGRMLAADLARTGVDVMTVCPGATRTPMFEASTLAPMSDDERRAFVEGLPKGRLIEPAEIAELVAFLCTPAARLLHGAVLDASLGMGVSQGPVSLAVPLP